MEITGHITRRRALAAAAALLAVLALGGKLLLAGGPAGAGAGAARVAGEPVGGAAPAAGAPAEIPVGADRTPAAAVLGGEATGTAAAPRPSIVVHVVGAVRRPGLYTLPEGSRAADAMTRAGGASAAADLEAIDLAAPIADGQQVAVPRREAAGAGPAPAPSAGVAGPAAPAAPAGPVHLNTATVEQLDALPGIGPSTAQKIIDYRSEHGAFRSVDELDAISGFGPAKVEQLRKLVAP